MPIQITSIISPRELLTNKDWVRGAIAFTLLGIFILEVIAVGIFVFCLQNITDPNAVSAAKDFFLLVLNPTVALVGAATGFYYGTSDKSGGA